MRDPKDINERVLNALNHYGEVLRGNAPIPRKAEAMINSSDYIRKLAKEFRASLKPKDPTEGLLVSLAKDCPWVIKRHERTGHDCWGNSEFEEFLYVKVLKDGARHLASVCDTNLIYHDEEGTVFFVQRGPNSCLEPINTRE